MAQLKKVLAGSFAVMMAATLMAGCGDSSSSKADTASKADGGDTSAADGGESKAEAVAPDNAEKLDGLASDKVVNIYCWNTEFKDRFEKYYWPARDTALWDGVKYHFEVNTNEGNVYQTKLDEALSTQANDEMKIDIFLVEADYALKYVNGTAASDVKATIGLTDDDLKDQYKYTKDVMTDSNGVLKGVSWQATPGLFLYNANYAKDVFGTDDPAEIQKELSDWTKFEAAAAKLKEKDIAIVSGFDDTYRCFSNNVSAPWVTDNKITVDPKIKEWVDQTKKFTDNGWNNKTSLWDTNWAAGQKIDGKTFGYFYSTWGIPFCLLPNTLDKAVKDGGKEEVGNGGYGLWKACPGPQAYFWGGTWICGCATADNNDIIKDIMKKMTCDAEIMAKITEGEQDYTNNKTAIKKLIDGGYTNPFLGGQNHLALLTEAADKLDLSNKLSAYDQGCNEKFQGAMKDYFLGNSTYDEALEKFKTDVTQVYSNLTF
jgi:hypothetical protein